MKKQQPEPQSKGKPIRQIIIETDGDIIRLAKAEVAGLVELRAILQSLIGYCDNPPSLKKGEARNEG